MNKNNLIGKLGKAQDGSFFVSFDMPKDIAEPFVKFEMMTPMTVREGKEETILLSVSNSHNLRGVIVLFNKVLKDIPVKDIKDTHENIAAK